MIDGEKYIVQLYGPTFGLTLYAKLIRLLGEPLVKLMSSFKGQDLKSVRADELDFDAIGEAFKSLFLQLRDDEFVPLIQEILSATFVLPSRDPVNAQFESLFMGRYTHVFKLVAKTLGVQYPDFLSVIGKRPNAVKSVPAGPQAVGG